MAMSGKPRKFVAARPVLDGITACCQLVEFSNWLRPPPPAFHAASPT
jgi:hypothetical protein